MGCQLVEQALAQKVNVCYSLHVAFWLYVGSKYSYPSMNCEFESVTLVAVWTSLTACRFMCGLLG